MFLFNSFGISRSVIGNTPKLSKPQFAPSVLSALGKRFSHEYAPRFKRIKKAQKGRVPVRTGGSTKGNTLKFGTYGLRLKSEGVRLKAIQLKEADNIIMKYMRPNGGKLWRRLSTSVAVCIKGNETRMGKGKGPFDHWMARVPTGKVLFECGGENLHEKVAREAFRVAADKLPGNYEFITIKSPVRVGLDSFKEIEPKVNFFKEIAKNPTKEWLNKEKANEEDIFKIYRNR
ncbi:hypothetical protein WICMUC_001924 [Wickerhamomyces mucosus]|uniref:Ribosomal protein L10e/L16 domain-containing protein n=1 Tax=Wickerhamomyces mucosus TaxID=1378264 RepID=A0A9P8PRK1_9ASCO|nr:hypothetical protein WICMUC_001924 [Wickerhamomyces mucosus]